MDGTLIDTDKMLFLSINEILAKYKNGEQKTMKEIYEFSGPPIRETFIQIIPDSDPDVLVDEFLRITGPMYSSPIVPTFPNAKEVIKDLIKEGFHFGVVTNKGHEMTEISLKYHELLPLMDVVIGLDDLKHGKPDREGIDKAKSITGAKRVLYIGDTMFDFLTAKNAEVDCCLVNWGPRALPSDIHPTFRINSYLELKEYLYE